MDLLHKFSLLLAVPILGWCSCSASKSDAVQASETQEEEAAAVVAPAFDADSAYAYVEKMVSFGPRVPNSEAHRKAGDWIVGKLREFGLSPIEQKASLKAFDGTMLSARNIFVQLNPSAPERILILTHWDCRPWADEDPDPAKRKMPVDGANDGASGVGVILEMARRLTAGNSAKGVDFLFVDAEDWGEAHNDDSWALGARYFVENPPVADYRPAGAILLDMVGSPDASFGYEYNSYISAPWLLQGVWGAAARLGHDRFHAGSGGAVTDDHVEFINVGIPAIDIIDYRNAGSNGGPGGFDPVWHTSADGMQNISRSTLREVGETLLLFLNEY